MVADDHQAPLQGQQLNGISEQFAECFHLLIHNDPQRLEHLRFVRMDLVGRSKSFEEFREFSRGFQLSLIQSLPECGSQPACIGNFAVGLQHPAQFLFVVRLQPVGGGDPRKGVHTHVQRALESQRKSTLRCIELMGGHPEIGQNAIHLLNPVQTKPFFDVPEVHPDEAEPLIVQCILPGIRILIECKKPSVGIQSAQKFPAVSASAKGAVDVDPAGLQTHSFQ